MKLSKREDLWTDSPNRLVCRRAGVSILELLVVVAILVILCSIFIPYVGKMRETNRRVGCADNLRHIHVAFRQYTDFNDRQYPRMPSDPQNPGMYVAFTGAGALPAAPLPAAAALATAPTTREAVPSTNPAVPGPPPLTPPDPATRPATAPAASSPSTEPGISYTAAGVQPNDVTAPLWLLIRLGYIQPGAFVCPGSNDTLDPMLTNGRRVPPAHRSNFTSGRHLSYSYCSPYSAAPEFRLNSDLLPPDFAIMADQNPGVTQKGSNAAGPAYNAPPLELAVANSRNHAGAGQNVLYVTGTVVFQNTPYCGYGQGWERDNIYSAYAATPLPRASIPPPEPGTELILLPPAKGVVSREVGPAWEYDSYLVPTEQD